MDAPEEEQVVEQEGTIKAKDIRGAVTYTYVNNSQVSATQVDIRVAFGETIPTVGLEPRVGVVMSLHHAKAFLGAFSKVLKSMEEKLGGINAIASDLKPLDS